MTQEREVRVEGNIHTVTISDDQKTLLAAKAAGRVVVGFLHAMGDQELSAAEYLIETLEGADEPYLERVVRRHLGMPWVIAESERLIIREFTWEDIPEVTAKPVDLEPDMVFCTASGLEAYIRNQYRFYEYGIWAVVRKADGVLLGKAGVCNAENAGVCNAENAGVCNAENALQDVYQNLDQLELGYHIFHPYRRQGYAMEACRTILNYVGEELGCPVYAVTNPANAASIGLLLKLGFVFIRQRYNAEGQLQYLYVWNC